MKKNSKDVMFVNQALFDKIKIDTKNFIECYYISKKKLNGISSFDFAAKLNLPYNRLLDLLREYPPYSFVYKVESGYLRYRELIHMGHIKHLMDSDISAELKQAIGVLSKYVNEHNKSVADIININKKLLPNVIRK